ncbi:isochorismatase family protein [Ruicaihuangia caeni]|uniref:Isochorismatase family protein n=1 Tax=Ruicaihuangia caeni TaxID=3042517 RepID=A0AAW6T9U3_9MICO|nr:isochorismatase family protein [Klugiella sp. YN-L-19]MDI2099139.1 isochorismatase family protein [Klugiella sp. YN-L-19]
MVATSGHAWGATVPQEDVDLYERAGFGRTAGLGERPAILVIDVQYRTVGHRRVPIEEAMKEYPTAAGDRGWRAIDSIVATLPVAREAGVPIFFPHVAPKTETTAGGFKGKSPTLASPNAEAYEFVAEAAPQGGDIPIAKDHPSSFFATPLVTHLIERRIDTVLLAGCTTSGCVRASAVDAFSYGFKVGVLQDAVYDRTDTVHNTSLFDMGSKYADLLDESAALAYLNSLRAQR